MVSLYCTRNLDRDVNEVNCVEEGIYHEQTETAEMVGRLTMQREIAKKLHHLDIGI
jgi:hypothetical protein